MTPPDESKDTAEIYVEVGSPNTYGGSSIILDYCRSRRLLI